MDIKQCNGTCLDEKGTEKHNEKLYITLLYGTRSRRFQIRYKETVNDITGNNEKVINKENSEKEDKIDNTLTNTPEPLI